MSTSLRKSTYPLIKQGLSDEAIMTQLGCCIKTLATHRKEINASHLPPPDHDWKKIQAFHDKGNGATACRRYFKLGLTSWMRAVKAGFLKQNPRKYGKKSRITIGMQFGRLTVIAGGEWKNRSVSPWTCRCDCGKEISVKTGSLNSLHKRSCGCMQRTSGPTHGGWAGHGEISSSFWGNIRNNSLQTREIPFEITIEEAWQLFLDQGRRCAVSGVSLEMIDVRNKTVIRTASLDRIDSSKGYVKGNVQWVHKWVNLMKLDHSMEDFIKWIDIIYNFQHQTTS